MTGPRIVIAGATGDLGARITAALTARGADVHALVRDDAPPATAERVRSLGATPVSADATDAGSIAAAVDGAAVVVSALNGLEEAILGRQGVLLDGTVQAGVPRFVPSDYSSDFTRTAPGHNRNFDLRRRFMQRVDQAPVRATSVLNGAFMDMLGAEMPIIQPRIGRVLYWGSADQPLDFTTKDDVAAYTAAAALDDTAPRILRVAGDVVSARDIASAASEVTGRTYRTQWAGTPTTLGAMAAVARRVAPQPGEVFPAWQGMQYTRDGFSGQARLTPLDNDRYPGMGWTSVREHLARALPARTGS